LGVEADVCGALKVREREKVSMLRNEFGVWRREGQVFGIGSRSMT
jgi:hypothetical protein